MELLIILSGFLFLSLIGAIVCIKQLVDAKFKLNSENLELKMYKQKYMKVVDANLGGRLMTLHRENGELKTKLRSLKSDEITQTIVESKADKIIERLEGSA